MPFLDRSGVRIYFEDHGHGAAILLSHGYGATCRMWDAQIARFAPHYRIIVWDMRGHGETDDPEDPAAYSEALTVEDMAALLRHCAIERAVRGVGVKWVHTLTHTYDVGRMRDLLKEALTTAVKGPKVIIAQSECMLNRQRRERPLLRKRMDAGERVVRERFGVDPDTCTGDHSCIRLSGCPSLTLAPNPDRLRREPVTKVINSCVGCGLCGEVAHAAVLCPSFYRASIIANPTRWDRLKHRIRSAVISALQRELEPAPSASV